MLADVGFVKNAGRSVPLKISPPSKVKAKVRRVRIRSQIYVQIFMGFNVVLVF